MSQAGPPQPGTAQLGAVAGGPRGRAPRNRAAGQPQAPQPSGNQPGGQVPGGQVPGGQASNPAGPLPTGAHSAVTPPAGSIASRLGAAAPQTGQAQAGQPQAGQAQRGQAQRGAGPTGMNAPVRPPAEGVTEGMPAIPGPPATPTASPTANPTAATPATPTPAAGGAAPTRRRPGRKQGSPERRDEIDPSCLTSEMEPISELIGEKRKVDATLARFSAVHDEMAQEERARRSKRIKLMPWLGKDEDMEEALGQQTALSPAPFAAERKPEPAPSVPIDQSGPISAVTRLQARRDKRHGRTMTGAKVVATVAAAIVLIVSFVGWRAKAAVTGDQIQEVAALDENSPAILNAAKQNGDANFLLVGTSNRPGSGAGSDNTTDTVIVAHVPGDGSRVVLVSMPPNLEVNRPACQRWDNQASATGSERVAAASAVKLDSVYSVGGPKCLTDTVQQVTGLRINHFVGIDLGGFRDVVNGLSGVDLCVTAPLKDATLGTIVDNGGPVTLSGDQALNFVRAAQIVGDQQPADMGRINRQQRFLAALLRKTIGQQNLLMSPNRLNKFLDSFTRSTFGDNLGVDQLAKLATSLQGLSLGRITFVTLPTTTDLNSAGNESLEADRAKQLFTAVIDNSPMPGETDSAQPSATGSPNADPRGIKVQVVNGIGDAATGAAKETANALSQQGFTINQIGGPAPPNVQQTVIKYSAAQQAQAKLLASSVPSATLQVDPTQDGAITLVIGPGFDHRVVAPRAGGAGGGGMSEVPAGLSFVNGADTSCR